MSDREKLIEMLKTIYKDYSVSPSDDLIANYLVSHGVTVREKGEWELNHIGAGHYWTCSVCGKSPCIYITEDTNFCPNCGADMKHNRKDDNIENN